MQRIHGHDPATITSPSTTSPPAQAVKPFKARRASGHPPLSHQTQIMKAVRRSSALPSLSISIPPEPTEDPVAGTDGISGEFPSKEERTKTVTFTNPEEEDDDGDSSDQSSICQSPSWEQYGRKKDKKPKKRETGENKKSKEDKPASTLKKKGNRLSKVPPPHVQGVEPLTASRAQSAPELDIYLKSKTASLDIQDSTRPGAMANARLESKPKSRGFLSGFRLQHGNVAAVQKIIDNQQPNDDRVHNSTSGVDPSFVNSRKPPSIQSAVSNSTRSISSLDQLPPSARNSSGSSHGRSQSLLTSTLNKLKGPSYLYFRPTENADNKQSQRPSSAQEHDIHASWLNEHRPVRPTEQSTDKKPARPKERPMTSDEHNQGLPEFTFPPKPKRVTTQLTPNTANRDVRSHAHLEESKDVGSGYESQEPTSFRSRRSQAPNVHPQNREQTAEKEKRTRTDRISRAPKQKVEFSNDSDNQSPPARQVRHTSRDVERRHQTNRQANGYVQPRVESWEESSPELDSPPSSRRNFANFDSEKSNQAEVSFRTDEEDDRGSVGTHASTIRPGSRKQGRNSPPEPDGRKHVTFPSSPNTIGRAVTSDPDDETHEVQVKTREPPKREKIVEDEIVPAPTKKPSRIDKSADYFSFISQSYAPPALDLRSPMDGKFPSPRIEEEPEEDDDLEHILRHIPVRRQVEELPTPPESVSQGVTSHFNAASRIAKQKLPKDSPSLSSHYSDSDVPAFERLGLSPKAARILAGTDISSMSTSQSNTDQSRTNSERSSSSTCDDPPPSPSTAPTPDSLRPQSHKESVRNHSDTKSCTVERSSIENDERTPRMAYKPPTVELPAKHNSRSTSRDMGVQDDSWSRTALPIDLDNNNPNNSSNEKLNGLNSNSRLPSAPTSVAITNGMKEGSGEEVVGRNPYQQSMLRAQSALDIHSTSLLPDIKQQSLYSKKTKAGVSSISLPNSPPAELVDGAPRKSALRSRKNSSNSEESSTVISPGAAYLQEARKGVPIPPVPTSRALRPHYAHKNSSNSIKTVGTSEGRSDPLAKMLVECCNCKFFHDMPSRVYECMAKPDSLVEDKLLGVSATITTMVKCPWCAHGMTTQCCSGYAAVVYLKEKLHGK
ncbi:hypothetical protein ABKA04_008410 [Annulohypoxylon sp. FPYF3050]